MSTYRRILGEFEQASERRIDAQHFDAVATSHFVDLGENVLRFAVVRCYLQHDGGHLQGRRGGPRLSKAQVKSHSVLFTPFGRDDMYKWPTQLRLFF